MLGIHFSPNDLSSQVSQQQTFVSEGLLLRKKGSHEIFTTRRLEIAAILLSSLLFYFASIYPYYRHFAGDIRKALWDALGDNSGYSVIF